MTPVPEWRQAWRWYSVQALAVLVVLPQAWEQIPPEVKAMIPPAWLPWIISGVAAAGVIGRVWPQRPKP